tara:strand:- start:1541 stop:1774 length:234 start_codon:yes stop_codon:yes gene_type:complete
MSPAKSKAQQTIMAMALAYKRGETKSPSKAVKNLAKSMSEKELEDYAKTDTKNLPKKVKKEEQKLREMIKGLIDEMD